MKDINKIKFYLNLLTIAYKIIPIFLHKPLRLPYLSEKLADKIDKTLINFNDSTTKFHINYLQKLESIKEIGLTHIKYHNYLINKHHELIYTYNNIIGFNDYNENSIKCEELYYPTDEVCEAIEYPPVADFHQYAQPTEDEQRNYEPFDVIIGGIAEIPQNN